MLSSRYRPWHVPIFLGKYAWLRMRDRPVLLNFEVTMRCNARCGFCDYWKTPADARLGELNDFAEIARRFSPMLVTFTGGEPTLRRDLEEIVASVRKAVRYTYVQLITHGALLSLERATSLWNAGVDQFNISLDYLDERHDVARGIPGLSQKILDLVPRMRGAGIGSVRFNTVIKNDNLDQLMPIVERAAALGGGVNFSLYTDFKNGNGEHLLGAAQQRQLEAVVQELLAYKQRKRGIITNSDYYLEQIPRYVRGEMTEPCRSGSTTIHIDPQGMVRRCPDFKPDGRWQDYAGYAPIDCNACYYACRGEAQAPLRLMSRVRDVMA
ncbi:MAG: radical SAM protein [Gemmatimonadota bacterium]|jgi:MoaA/NifB/PqqE/SkfB family radical SAM enzyme|nr:radical SAM protein [Gemmatimonadota bacterium]MDQ8166429.1 radical SAM protein [Gemmatimonadota bacterium]MDQ8172284.1 radical SAM protein [Gemmatimonadota bacterium]